jgi:hypothetical protein
MSEKEISEIVEQFTKANAKQNETIMNFGFWFMRGKKGEKEVDLAKELLKQNNIDFNDTGKFGIDFNKKGYTIKKIKDLMLENKIVEYVIYHTEE